MATRVIDGTPHLLPLYARAAATIIPGASRLPFLPGGHREIPELELEQAGVRTDPAALAAYARVCGFALREHLPPTYPHVLAFPLHMAVMADGSFPFGAVGLVHLENRILQRRPIAVDEELTLRVTPTPLAPHPKGRTFALLTVASVDGEPVWEERSTFLRRGKPSSEAALAEGFPALAADAPAGAEWRLGGDLGRRYAAVSGDRNPIHMHSLTARPLGFPAAIAHGMWTKARCLAALENRLPTALETEVRFRKPIRLPGTIAFASAREGEDFAFAVRDARLGTPHLDGRAGPLAAGNPERSAE